MTYHLLEYLWVGKPLVLTKSKLSYSSLKGCYDRLTQIVVVVWEVPEGRLPLIHNGRSWS